MEKYIINSEKLKTTFYNIHYIFEIIYCHYNNSQTTYFKTSKTRKPILRKYYIQV